MAKVTLAQLKQRTREQADQVNSRFIAETELRDFINGSAAELYDLLVQSCEDYNLESESFSVTSSSPVHTLPADFYKLRGVDFSVDGGGTYLTVKKFDFQERNRGSRRLAYARPECAPVRYRLVGSQIRFTPEQDASGSYRIWYVPEFVKLVADADEFEGYNSFEEYIVVDAAIKCMAKEESDTAALERRKAGLALRIKAMSNDRDHAEPDKIARVRREDSEECFE